MNPEDFLTLAFVIVAATGAIGLSYISKWKLWIRAALMFVVIFALSSVDEHLSRALFHDFTRGTVFTRVFLITLGCIMVYLLLSRERKKEVA